MTVRAAILSEAGQELSVVDDIQLDPPRDGEILVRVEHCGVCHSDLHVADGILPCPRPAIVGHEAAGTIEEVGPGVTGLVPGDKVVLSARPPCGRCYWCVRGEWAYCGPSAALAATGTFPNGGTRLARDGVMVHRGMTVLACFAEQTVVPAAAAVKLPDDTDLGLAALLGCAVLTGAGAILNTANVQPGDTVAVIGLGGVGSSAVQASRIAGASRVFAIDKVAARREQARRFGATDLIDPNEADFAKQVVALTEEVGADHVVECVGSAALIETALKATRRRGTTVIVGIPPASAKLELRAISLLDSGRKLVGSSMGDGNPQREIARLVDLWRSGQFQLEAMVSEHRPLNEINDALADMRGGVGLRTVIDL